MKTHPIDQDRLLKAAAQLGEICDAGADGYLLQEFWARYHEDDACRFQDQDSLLHEWQIKDRAKKLSLVTCAPMWQCEAAVREAMGDLPVRAMGLELLREFSQQARRKLAMERRQGCRR